MRLLILCTPLLVKLRILPHKLFQPIAIMRRVLSEINVHFFRGPNEVSDKGKSINDIIICQGGMAQNLIKIDDTSWPWCVFVVHIYYICKYPLPNYDYCFRGSKI